MHIADVGESQSGIDHTESMQTLGNVLCKSFPTWIIINFMKKG